MSKTALVTGASSGIGHNITTNLSQSGYTVIAIDHNHSKFPDNVTPFYLDLKDSNALAKIINNISQLDIAVNCAGVPCNRKELTKFNGKELASQWQDNFIITFNALKFEILKMRKAQRGKIINISSSTAHRGMKNMLAYSSAKASISIMTKVAAIENAEYNIQINSISPATIDTPMIRKKYNGVKRDYSDVFYTGDCGSTQDIYVAVKMYIDNNFLTGHDLVIDGGLSNLCEI